MGARVWECGYGSAGMGVPVGALVGDCQVVSSTCGSTVGTQWEHSGSTVGAQWEYIEAYTEPH